MHEMKVCCRSKSVFPEKPGRRGKNKKIQREYVSIESFHGFETVRKALVASDFLFCHPISKRFVRHNFIEADLQCLYKNG
jgi:hypothetical protein